LGTTSKRKCTVTVDQTMNDHHWLGPKPRPDKFFGFVYIITNKINGRMYIGKKQFHVWSKRKIAKESKWQFYTGSSKELNEDIKKHGKENFEFKIIKQYKTRGGLVYAEANLQHKRDVLVKTLDGSDLRLYYNKQVGAIRFIPKEF
jgi:predicted GIY-YIG superfamily endonuclease